NAENHLSKALAWMSSDQETAYYLGLAQSANGEDRSARTHLEFAQQSNSFHVPALLALAALEARTGNRDQALKLVQDAIVTRPDLPHAGTMELALLRSLGRQGDARNRLAHWLNQDPTSSLLRWEAAKLGTPDASLLAHLAGDPQRIIELASNYMNFGLYADALDVLSQKYPAGADVVSEPGMPRANSY